MRAQISKDLRRILDDEKASRRLVLGRKRPRLSGPDKGERSSSDAGGVRRVTPSLRLGSRNHPDF